VHKNTDPTGSQQTFEFNPDWDDNFFLKDGESNISIYLAPGTYWEEIIPRTAMLILPLVKQSVQYSQPVKTT